MLKNLRLSQKYGIALTVTILLFGISTVLSYFMLNKVQHNVTQLEQGDNRALYITQMEALIKSKKLDIDQYLIIPDQQIIKDYKHLQTQFKALKPKIYVEHPAARKLYNSVIKNDTQIDELLLKTIVPGEAIGSINSSWGHQIKVLEEDSSKKLVELRQIVLNERTQYIQSTDRMLKQTVFSLIVSVIISILLGIIIIFFISRAVRKSLSRLVHTAEEVAEGNLLIDTSEAKGRDEIAQLTTAINKMVAHLTHMVKQMSGAAQNVSSQSEEMTQSSAEVSVATTQISTTMQELATGADRQANATSDAATQLNDFMDKIEHETQNSEKLNQVSDDIVNITTTGYEKMTDSVTQMDVIYQIVQEAVDKVKGLDQSSQQINKLINVISDISEQTNLLSLNAAIEAARAGEHGRGFAVVAEEVRKLSEEVSHSVTEINGIIKGIQQGSQDVSHSLQKGYKQVEKGKVQMKETGQAFEKIQRSIHDMGSRIQSMSKNLIIINQNGNELNQSLEHIASISQQSLAGVEETSASIQQTTSTMEEIKASSEYLSKLSEDLNHIIQQFKI